MLAQGKPIRKGLGEEEIQQIKEKIYGRIVEYGDGEDFPAEANPDFGIANVEDLVYTIVNPIITAFKRTTRQKSFSTKKAITALGSNASSYLHPVKTNIIGLESQEFIVLVETMSESLGEAMLLCMLTMKDLAEDNSIFVVCGFVTTGEFWEMVRFDGRVFTPTETLQVLFSTMAQDKESRLKEAAIVVDCLHLALRSGGLQ